MKVLIYHTDPSTIEDLTNHLCEHLVISTRRREDVLYLIARDEPQMVILGRELIDSVCQEIAADIHDHGFIHSHVWILNSNPPSGKEMDDILARINSLKMRWRSYPGHDRRFVFFDEQFQHWARLEKYNTAPLKHDDMPSLLREETGRFIPQLIAARERHPLIAKYFRAVRRIQPRLSRELTRFGTSKSLLSYMAVAQIERYLAILALYLPGVDLASIPWPQTSPYGDFVRGGKIRPATLYHIAAISQLGIQDRLLKAILAVLNFTYQGNHDTLAIHSIHLAGLCHFLFHVCLAQTELMMRWTNPDCESLPARHNSTYVGWAFDAYCDFWNYPALNQSPEFLRIIREFQKRQSELKFPGFLSYSEFCKANSL